MIPCEEVRLRVEALERTGLEDQLFLEFKQCKNYAEKDEEISDRSTGQLCEGCKDEAAAYLKAGEEQRRTSGARGPYVFLQEQEVKKKKEKEREEREQMKWAQQEQYAQQEGGEASAGAEGPSDEHDFLNDIFP